DALMAPLDLRHADGDRRPAKERNHTMNAQLSANLRRIGLPAFSVGLGVLLVGAAIIAATLTRPSAPARHVAVQSAPVSRGVPIQGTGSAYDGRHYGAVQAAPRTSSNLPIVGTGSAYDGGRYGGFVWASPTAPNLSAIGTGSVYDGKHYGALVPAAQTAPNLS